MRISSQPKSLNHPASRARQARQSGDLVLRRAITPLGEALSTLPWLEGLALLAFLMLAIG